MKLRQNDGFEEESMPAFKRGLAIKISKAQQRRVGPILHYESQRYTTSLSYDGKGENQIRVWNGELDPKQVIDDLAEYIYK